MANVKILHWDGSGETDIGVEDQFLEGPNVKLEGVEDEDAKPIVIPEGACEKCLHVLSIGEFPFCPHGFGGASVISDEIVGGMVMDHVEVGRKVYYKSELKSVLAAKGWMLDDHKTEKEFARIAKDTRERAWDTKKSPPQ